MTYLDFTVTPADYRPASGLLKVDWTMGFKAPDTVLKSDARYTLTPVLLQFGPQAWLTEPAEATSQLCFSGFAFNCTDQGLTERTEVTEPLDLTTQAPGP